MKTLPEDVCVSPQFSPEQMAELAGQGIKTIINNRPDGEMVGQPTSDAVKQAAEAAGLVYYHIPMARELTSDLISQSAEVYRTAERPIAAFCASGTRSTVLWCFVHASDMGVDGVLAAASQAGYNLEHIRESLNAFSGKRNI